MGRRLILLALSACAISISAQPCPWPTTLGFYALKCDAEGNIVSPWPSLEDALAAEMKWYSLSPPVSPHGYPTWMYSTFVDGNYSIMLPQVHPA